MHDLGLRLRDLVGRNAARFRHAVEHAVARAMRGLGRAVGPADFRRLRDRDQQGGFGEREALRLLAEIGVRGRAHAFEIAAIGRKAEIEREDLVLGERAFELDRAHRLAQFCAERAIRARLEQPRDLHGDGRAARHDAAVRDELERRAGDRQRIDAVVLAEALVLVGDQQIEIARIDVLHGRGQSPASVDRRVGAQQLPVAVDHDGGELEALAERHGTERMDPCGEGERAKPDDDRSRDRCDAKATPRARSVPSPLAGGGLGRGVERWIRCGVNDDPHPQPLPAVRALGDAL